MINSPMNLSSASPYDGIADVYDAAFDEHNAYYAQIESCERALFDRWVRPASGQRALDIGCGTGLHSRWLAENGYQVLGIDISLEMLKRARSNCQSFGPQVEFIRFDATMVHTLPGGFSVITCLGSTLNHISDWSGFLRGAAGLLAPGGVLVFNFDNIRGLDVLFWLAKSGRHVYPRQQRLGLIWRRVRCAVLGTRFENHWAMELFGRAAELSLTYDSLAAVSTQLAANGLVRTAVRGTHILTPLSPAVMEQAAFVDSDHEPAPLGCVSRAILSADRVLGMVLPTLASNVVVVAARPAGTSEANGQRSAVVQLGVTQSSQS